MATKRRTDQESPRQPGRPEESEASGSTEPDGGQRKPEEAAEAASDTAQAAAAPDAPETEKAPRADTERADTERADTEKRLLELASQLEEANSQRLRLAADFDNYKKRSRQEQMDTMRYASAAVAERLLPVLDDAERALSHVPDGVDEGWLKGVRLVVQKLDDVLSSVGVERIEAVGSAFDPKLHEAVASEETTEHPEDTVVVELRPGYRMHERVLRPALVKVARHPA